MSYLSRGKIVPFEFNGPQKILHKIVSMIEGKRLVRVIALKARRMGVLDVLLRPLLPSRFLAV